MTPFENVLGRVELARPRQPGQVSARCPAHADKGPSLSIRETPEGAVLLHCFAGCNVQEIVGAMGLELHELFPPRDKPPGAPKRTAKLITHSQALDLLHDEANFIGVCAGNIGQGVTLTDEDRQRAIKAAGRVNFLRDQVMGGAHA
jgi:hypothetical protein